MIRAGNTRSRQSLPEERDVDDKHDRAEYKPKQQSNIETSPARDAQHDATPRRDCEDQGSVPQPTPKDVPVGKYGKRVECRIGLRCRSRADCRVA